MMYSIIQDKIFHMLKDGRILTIDQIVEGLGNSSRNAATVHIKALSRKLKVDGVHIARASRLGRGAIGKYQMRLVKPRKKREKRSESSGN